VSAQSLENRYELPEELEWGEQYWWRIRVNDGAQWSPWSEGFEIAVSQSRRPLVLDHSDDFSSDTRSDYPVWYRSNNNGVVTYSLGELGFMVTGWNGIRVKNTKATLFPEYTKSIFKVTDFAEGISGNYGQYSLEWIEFGNAYSSWPTIYIMNSFQLYITGNKVRVVVRRDDLSNPNANGDIIISNEYQISLSNDTWHSVEIIRENLEVSLYLKNTYLATVSIPSNFLNLEMNLSFGGDSSDGHDASVCLVEYGDY
jgi:hypothetical protein